MSEPKTPEATSAGPRRVEPSRPLLKGGPYTPAAETDITVLFRRTLLNRQMFKDYKDPWEDE